MLQLQPELAELKEQGVDLYVVALGDTDELKDFFTDNKIEATVMYDPNGLVFQLYEISAIPHTFFIDKEGRVASESLGWNDNDFNTKVKPVLKALLAE